MYFAYENWGKVGEANGRSIKNAVAKIEQIRNQRGELYPTEVAVKKDEWSVSTNDNGKYSIDEIPAVWPLRLALCFIRDKKFPNNLRIAFCASGYGKKVIDAFLIKKGGCIFVCQFSSVLKKDRISLKWQ